MACCLASAQVPVFSRPSPFITPPNQSNHDMDDSRGRDPVLEKLTDAFGHACKVYTVGAGLAPLPPHSRFVQGECVTEAPGAAAAVAVHGGGSQQWPGDCALRRHTRSASCQAPKPSSCAPKPVASVQGGVGGVGLSGPRNTPTPNPLPCSAEFKAVLGPEGFLQCATLVTWCPQSHTLTLSFRGSHTLFDQVGWVGRYDAQ